MLTKQWTFTEWTTKLFYPTDVIKTCLERKPHFEIMAK